jgi:uncharacterized protein YunC (DUF1805 family)
MGSDISNQIEVHSGSRGRIMCMGSAYDVDKSNRGRDIAINASYCGVLPARFVCEHQPRGAIGVDCGIGPAGASIAGLWYMEALNIPGAVADVMTVRLGDGVDLYEKGIISLVNRPAMDCGVRPGMRVKEAARLMLESEPAAPSASEVTNRTVMEKGPKGRLIICTDSIAFGLAEDSNNVLLTAGHTGISALPYLRRCKPFGFICSDGGKGREDSGVAGMAQVASEGLYGATVDARRAKMGDGLSTWHDGIISAVNSLAASIGVKVGMTAQEAARILVNRDA